MLTLFVWVPIVFLSYCLQGYLSAGKHWVALWILGALPLWALVSKYSPAVVRDALIFDAVLFVGFQVGMFMYGSHAGFGWQQWLGICMVLGGTVVFNLG